MSHEALLRALDEAIAAARRLAADGVVDQGRLQQLVEAVKTTIG